MQSIASIVQAQASVGYIDDAFRTAHLIKHSDTNIYCAEFLGQSLSEIAAAQAKRGAVAAAIATAASIKNNEQYKDDAFCAIVDVLLANHKMSQAMDAAGRIDDLSLKAIKQLKIAIAYAKSGDRSMAKKVAGAVDLTPGQYHANERSPRFDYTKPETWGVNYQLGFTMGSWAYADRLAADLAASAMTLRQLLRDGEDANYADAFKKVFESEIIRAIARAHSAAGDPLQALAWAEKIGADAKVTSHNDHEIWAVEQRIGALMGVAEGILDRQPNHPAVEK